MSLATASSLPRREEQRERVRVVAREEDDLIMRVEGRTRHNWRPRRAHRSSLDGERARASIEQVGDDDRAKAEQFEDREEALRERFQQAMYYVGCKITSFRSDDVRRRDRGAVVSGL